MCGIGSVTFLKSDKNPEVSKRNKMAQILTGEILIETLPRGKDATGVALLHENKSFAYLKGGLPSPEMVAVVDDKEEYPHNWETLLDHWDSYHSPVVNILAHVRKATQGDSHNEHNCHPITRGSIVGIHNGGLDNDKTIMEALKDKVEDRKGECDSEALFALMEHMGGEEEWTPEMVQDLTKEISGAFTVLAVNHLFPHKLVMFRNPERPAAVGIDFNLDLMVIGSEPEYIRKAVAEYNRIAGLYFRGDLPLVKMTPIAMQQNCGWIFDSREAPETDSVYDYIKERQFEVKFRFSRTMGQGAGFRGSSGTHQNVYQQQQQQRPPPSQCSVAVVSKTEPPPRRTLADGEYYNVVEDDDFGDTFAESEVLAGGESPKCIDVEAEDVEVEESSESEEESYDTWITKEAESAFDMEDDQDLIDIVEEIVEGAFNDQTVEDRGIEAKRIEKTHVTNATSESLRAGYVLGYKACSESGSVSLDEDDKDDEIEELTEELQLMKAQTHEWAQKMAKKEEIATKSFQKMREFEHQLDAVRKCLLTLSNMGREKTHEDLKELLAALAAKAQVSPDLLFRALEKDLEDNAHTKTRTANA